MALWQHLHVLQSSLQKLNFIFDLRFAWVLRSCDMLIPANWTFPALVERGLILSRNSRGEHTIGAFAFAERGLSWSSRFCLRHSWQRSPCALRRFVCLPMNLIACAVRAPMGVSVRSAYIRTGRFELTSCSSRAGEPFDSDWRLTSRSTWTVGPLGRRLPMLADVCRRSRCLSWGAIAVFAVALPSSSVLRASSLYNGAD